MACAPDRDPTPVVLQRDAAGGIGAILFGELTRMVRTDAIAPWA
jgi:hypothetical protein